MMKTSDLENFPEYSVSYRLKVIQDLLKIRSVAAFANEIGVDTSVLNNIMSPYGRKGKPSFDTLQKIACKFPRVNIDWLVTGKGEPLRPFGHNAGQSGGNGIGTSEDLLERISFGEESSANQGNDAGVPELKSMLKVCQVEKENLEKILALKDELIEVLKNRK